MTVILAVANQKGGVGKTMLSIQLCYDLVLKRKKKVLFIDMDSQGNGSSSLLDHEQYEELQNPANDCPFHVTKIFAEDFKGVTPCTNQYGIDILASRTNDEESYRLEAENNEKFSYLPKKNLAELVKKYDYVIVDCPPTLAMKLRAALLMATHVICPIRPACYAVDGMEGVLQTIRNIKQAANPDLKFTGAIINGYIDSSNNRESVGEIFDKNGQQFVGAIIRSRPPYDTAGMKQKPVWRVPGGTAAAAEIAAAFKEIYKNIDDGVDLLD